MTEPLCADRFVGIRLHVTTPGMTKDAGAVEAGALLMGLTATLRPGPT
jgi:hypothetical protein